ncbi:MAG: ATP synthase subunit I [Pseudomonadota bacterium]
MGQKTQPLAMIQAPKLGQWLLYSVGSLCAVSALLAWLVDLDTALSVWSGGLLAISGHAYFAWYAFRYQGAKYARLIWKGFTKGEAGRFSIVIIGFCMIFKVWPAVDVLPLFISFIGCYFMTLFLGSRTLM